MSISLNDNIQTNAPKPSDARYLNNSVAWIDVAEVNTNILETTRHIGLTVNISGTEYWYKDGVADTDLVVKSSGGATDIAIQQDFRRFSFQDGVLASVEEPRVETETVILYVETPANGGDDVNGDGSALAPFATLYRALMELGESRQTGLSGNSASSMYIYMGEGDFDMDAKTMTRLNQFSTPTRSLFILGKSTAYDTGLSFALDPTDSTKVTITKDGLPTTYTANELRFKRIGVFNTGQQNYIGGPISRNGADYIEAFDFSKYTIYTTADSIRETTTNFNVTESGNVGGGGGASIIMRHCNFLYTGNQAVKFSEGFSLQHANIICNSYDLRGIIIDGGIFFNCVLQQVSDEVLNMYGDGNLTICLVNIKDPNATSQYGLRTFASGMTIQLNNVVFDTDAGGKSHAPLDLGVNQGITVKSNSMVIRGYRWLMNEFTAYYQGNHTVQVYRGCTIDIDKLLPRNLDYLVYSEGAALSEDLFFRIKEIDGTFNLGFGVTQPYINLDKRKYVYLPTYP